MKQSHFNAAIKTRSRWTQLPSRTPTSPWWLFNIQHTSEWSLSIPLKAINVLICKGLRYYCITFKKVMGAYLSNTEQTGHRTRAVQGVAGQNRAVYFNHPKGKRGVLFWVLHLLASLHLRTWREKSCLWFCNDISNQSLAFCNDKVFFHPPTSC